MSAGVIGSLKRLFYSTGFQSAGIDCYAISLLASRPGRLESRITFLFTVSAGRLKMDPPGEAEAGQCRSATRLRNTQLRTHRDDGTREGAGNASFSSQEIVPSDDRFDR
jgi:hypothetical protein